MLFLGIDIGSSAIKLSVLDAGTNSIVASLSVPGFDMPIHAPKFGWAEQHPEKWWGYIKRGIVMLKDRHNIPLESISGIGIAYQMHGLVLTDKELNPVRPSIIWCDSRAVEDGNRAYELLGTETAQNMLLGSPGNFTASKLKWVKTNEPDSFAKAAYMMLPGDYIAAKLTGIAQTTPAGLSEAALWHFPQGRLAGEVLDVMELPENLVPEIVPVFGQQAMVSPKVAAELGLNPKAMVTYRAGDQPNNAMSLNVFNPGEIAATAGTSAVVYAVSETDSSDSLNRINTFLHVNNSEAGKRNGVMLCINGAGSLYQWLRRTLSIGGEVSYDTLNAEAGKTLPGSKGLRFYPFGNGVERIFSNQPAFSGVANLNFNIHQTPELVRSACEGIVFAMNYGFDIMKEAGAGGSLVRAGQANLFLSPVFREIFANTTQTTVELYNTSGADGAARGAAYGYGYYKTLTEAFSALSCLQRTEPDAQLSAQYREIYDEWKKNIYIEQPHEYSTKTSLF